MVGGPPGGHIKSLANNTCHVADIMRSASDITHGMADITHDADVSRSAIDILCGVAEICFPKTHFFPCFGLFQGEKYTFSQKILKNWSSCRKSDDYFYGGGVQTQK